MSPEQTTPDNDVSKTAKRPPVKPPRRRFSWGFLFALIAIVAIGAGGAYQYQENERLQDELRQQKNILAQIKDAGNKELDESRDQQVGQAERLDKLENTVQTLSGVYQNIHNNETQRLFADVEQTLAMASETLHITNDVPATLKLLQYADSKLKGVNKPEAIKLYAALQKDIQALQALPMVDMAAEVARIETLLNGIDTLPLNIDIQRALSQPTPPVAPVNAGMPWWERIGSSIWNQLKSLVSIRRLDKPEQALLSVDEVNLIRENMKLRAMSARIALMTHNQAMYEADLNALQKYLDLYFDQKEASTQQAAEAINQLLQVKLGSMNKLLFTSLDVVRNAQQAVPAPAAASAPTEGEKQ